MANAAGKLELVVKHSVSDVMRHLRSELLAIAGTAPAGYSTAKTQRIRTSGDSSLCQGDDGYGRTGWYQIEHLESLRKWPNLALPSSDLASNRD